MIRKLKEKDRERILTYLSDEPAINLFIIGDIEAFGFDKDFMELWEMYNDLGETQGILLRFYESFIPYYKDNTVSSSEFLRIINEFKSSKQVISGREDIVERFENDLNTRKTKSTFFCELTHKNNLDLIKEDVKVAIPEDYMKIHNTLSKIDEFDSSTPDPERIKSRLSDNSSRIYYIEDDNNNIISLAQTTAESSNSAMIVGVATLKEYRGRGYISQCMSKLSNTLISEGKSLCLFYDNPKAGSIYHRLGFNSIGKWKMLFIS